MDRGAHLTHRRESAEDTLAPIVLFCYARPLHLRRTVAALAANALADQSRLIIFSDGPRGDGDEKNVNAVRSEISRVSGFSEVRVVLRETNFGLASNITEGVGSVMAQFGRAIVLEDDVVVAPCFLGFMNEALERYEDDSRVWHISGWNYSIDPTGLPDSFFWRGMNCWGWGTWSDRWCRLERDASGIMSRMPEAGIQEFNIDGSHDFWRQMVRNHQGTLDSWAVFWYASIFLNGGLCLNATRSLVENIGLDGSGENCTSSSTCATETQPPPPMTWPESAVENELAVSRIRKVYSSYRKNVFQRAKVKVRKLLSR